MYPEIRNGINVVDSADEYFNLNIDASGYVILNIAGDSGGSAIYDQQLNFVAYITSVPRFLEAGSYIVHAAYSSKNLAALNAYIPQIAVAGDLADLVNGSYVGTTWDHYYDLTLPENGNVFLSVAGDRGGSAIYDKALNFVANITSEPLYLAAGSYIVHAAYSSKNLAALNACIPQTAVAGDIAELDDGTYVGSTWDQYYRLSMYSDGNVFLNVFGDSGASAIYDENLDYVVDITSGPIFLGAGSYLVHVNYSSKSQAYLEVSIPVNGEGTGGGDLIVGRSRNDSLNGYDGNDTLDGSAGSDTMVGGAGNDTFYVDNAGDVIIEVRANGGIDMVISSVSYTLIGGIENLTLVGADAINCTGNLLENVIRGNGAGNALRGGSGDDFLVGNGGDDTLIGGLGADTLDGGAGMDFVAYSAATSSVVVNLAEAATSGADGADNLIGIENACGSNYDDALMGNVGNNVLNGLAGIDSLMGGAGNDTLDGGTRVDTLVGGTGNDFFLVTLGDIVTESAGEGTDTVQSGVTWTLSDNVERLVLTGITGTSGTGNLLGNRLTGNYGSNLLSGLNGNDSLIGGLGNDTLDGGGGIDTLVGGNGDDLFIVTARDAVSENSAEGVDTVQSAGGWVLSDNIERLVLTGSFSVIGTGNVLANTITGNGGKNTLSGLDGNDTLDGGLGRDTLTGGVGNDAFVFSTAPFALNADTITDFTHLSDKLCLDDDVFTQLTAGVGLLAAQIYSAAGAVAAHDADDRIVYNTTTGSLYYDADGNLGGSSAVLFASLGTATHPEIMATDFSIVA